MFAQAFNALMSHCRTDAIQIPRAAGALRTRAESDALDAMRRSLGSMPLSERLKNPASYHALQSKRRGALLSLLMIEPTPDVIARIVDLVGMIAEEITWSKNPENTAFEDENHPDIDLQAAETAVLLAWTNHILGERLDACVTGRMRSEVRRRVFKPVLVHDDYPFMLSRGACPMAICADILLAAILLETDEARVGRVVKPMLKLLDDACGRHGRSLVPMEEAVIDISAASDLVQLLRDMTRSYVDLSQGVPAGDWLDEILYPWIQEDLFNDPAGDGMQPNLSGSDIFRIGSAAGDEPLISLGAHLHHRSHRPAATVTGRLLEPAFAEALENTYAKPQRLKYAFLNKNLLMCARMPGLYCSLHVGGGRGNAGDVILFSENQPILADCGRGCAVRNLPVIAGRAQLEQPERPCIADFEPRQDQEQLSVDLTNAYPAACGLRSYQRTALILRAEQVVRIVDAIDLAQPAPVTFRFVSAVRPTVVREAIRLGSVRMTWEGEFDVNTAPLENGLTLIELTAIQPVRQEFFTFNFEHS